MSGRPARPSGLARNSHCGFLRARTVGDADAGAGRVAHDVRVRRLLVPVVVALALASGLALKLAGEGRIADGLWILVLLAVILPLAVRGADGGCCAASSGPT